MDLARYEINQESEDLYWFVSSKGSESIVKVISMQETEEDDIVNLAMGDYINGKLDYNNISDNKDAEKVLASISTIVEHYTETFLNKSIFIIGNTPVKTRFYQIYISHYLEEIQNAGYVVRGYPENGGEPELFVKGKKYRSFLVKRIQ